MKKVLLWFITDDARHLEGALDKLNQVCGGIDLVASVAGADIDGVRTDDIDVILVVGAKSIGMSDVVKAARQLHLPEEKLLGDWIACLPGFTLDKYRRLQRSQLSILSMNCFGGCVSHMLGLPFRSPTVNMFFSDEDFVKFLHAPKFYLESEPRFERLDFSWAGAPNGYPVLALEDIRLNMMHYKTADAAVDKWLKRKARINWYNSIAIMFTEDEKILREFDALPFGKKVCFVPFESDADSAWHINPDVDAAATSFADRINRFSFGHFIYFDLFDMLLYDRKTPLEI